ncbi:MAG: 16S rRNA (guanine(527)-N(7))-methyltransferase RsmG [Rickettsiales bacterium]|jgi:16S rRNA (guanine527-N7)-methyltransferase|nr:16S rRNA (guanine(527)-N(7))-methyltransferase RsmG [Rickettsiales bacterium]
MNNKEKFERYAEILREWSGRMNLVAPSTLDDIETRHIADSAQLVEYLPKDVRIIDLGSGAGFPGVVLAILGWSVVCIESIGKKAGFLNELKKELDLPNLTVVNDRIENYLKDKGQMGKSTKSQGAGEMSICPSGHLPIIFTARAFASLDKILEITKNVQKGRYFLLKGQGVKDEIALAKKHHKFDYRLYPSKTGDGFVLIMNSEQ